MADKILAQKEQNSDLLNRAEFIPHHERIPKRNHSAEMVQRTINQGERAAEHNEERSGEASDGRKSRECSGRKKTRRN